MYLKRKNDVSSATYWLSFEILHCGEIFKNHTFRKEELIRGVLFLSQVPASR
jgi:hypothetical protein